MYFAPYFCPRVQVFDVLQLEYCIELSLILASYRPYIVLTTTCSSLASATGLEGKGEKEACYNLFSHARTFPEFWEFCMYVNEFTVYFTIKYPTFPRGQKQVVAGLLSFPRGLRRRLALVLLSDKRKDNYI